MADTMATKQANAGRPDFSSPVDVEAARQFIRPAIIEHLRHWWGSDALFQKTIIKSDGKVCPKTLRNIARAYGVSRGILKDREADVAQMLDAKLSGWPSTLTERAQFVQEMARQAQSQNFTKGILLSAFSKIIWFTRPEGWTLYDSFARRGLKAKRADGQKSDFERYYNRLDVLKFQEAMKAGKEVIAKSQFPYLWPERIHDKYLMYLGHDPANGLRVVDVEAHDALLVLWEQFYGPKIIEDIEELVCSFTAKMCHHQAFQPHTLQEGN